jgi:CelD/BcsL family acetyltransferase involved in cellulose biosynthesis
MNGPHRANLVCDRGEPQSTASALLHVIRQLPIDWIMVRGALPDSVLARVIPETRLHEDHASVIRVEMADGWEATYRRKIGTNHRNRDRRKLRRLQELGKVEFDVARSGEHLDRCLTDAFSIYGRRWRDRPGEAGGFYDSSGWREVAQRLGAAYHVQLVVLRVDGQPIAFSYSFLLGETMWSHRMAFDPEWSNYSPGWLTILHALQLASDAGARYVDFGIGEEEYKVRLADTKIPLLWGALVTAGLRGAIGSRADEAMRALQLRAKSSPRLVELRNRAVRVKKRIRGGATA